MTSPRIIQNRDLFEYLDPPLVHKTSKEKKFMKRENFRERKFLYPSDEAIMIEIIRDHIKVTQYGLTMIDVINFG